LGWGEKTIRLYWEALGIEEQVHQAQAQRRVEEQQERLDALRYQVETTLYALLSQDDEITLCRVSAALGHTPEYLCNYPCLAERIQEVGQLHRIQTRKRQYEMVAAQIHQAIEEAKRENGTLTVHGISQRTGMTHQRLSRVFPELHALVQDAVNEHRARMRTECVKAQCAQINAAAMQLVAQGSRLTQAAILRQAGLQTYSTTSNPVVVELLRTWTSDFAPHD
jgi:hypothetical protein